MCPGNERASGEKNPEYEGTFVFDNDFPAVTASGSGSSSGDGQAHEAETQTHELFQSRPAEGRCRVLCYSERHNQQWRRMRLDDIVGIIEAWDRETRSLGAAPNVAHIQIFENRGAMMGASNPHPHGQIWAVSDVPTLAQRKAERLAAFHRSHGRDLLGVYIEEERKREERIVAESEHWVWLVPFWAVWPFETMLLPTRRLGRISELHTEERLDLARMLRCLNQAYDRVFDCEFPYSMGWSERAVKDDENQSHRLHAAYLPPLVRSATVRKFIVGYELTAEPQRDISAEFAAHRLRQCLAAAESESAE
jgi:UDPglucose--hexose-1-phosphate uridylyltransferase